MARKNNTGRKPDYSKVLSGSRPPQNKAHDSPSRPGQQGHTVDVRPRVIKSPKPAPNLPNPKATVYQKPSVPIKDNQYPGMPHVDKKNMASPKKEPGYVWRGSNVDILPPSNGTKKGKRK